MRAKPNTVPYPAVDAQTGMTIWHENRKRVIVDKKINADGTVTLKTRTDSSSMRRTATWAEDGMVYVVVPSEEEAARPMGGDA